jgi:photosystem II stability/assembly factor-like uncharacterized protein
MGFIRKSLRLVLVLAALVAFAAQAGFNGVLNTPAMPTRLAAQRPLNSVVVAGSRLVAAGHRGHIVYSDDQGKSWTQASVPVSSDLTAVFFSSSRTGWAVGHDGVVLRSGDGGQSWQLQLDGKRAETLIKDYYGKKAEAGDTQAAELLPEIERDFSSGADKPFLDVWFANDREGFVVGAFNMIFRTVDGGETWVPWYDRVDNPRRLHLYSIRGAGGRVYLAGELGFIASLDNEAERFAAIQAPYEGSFFGVLPIGDGAVVYGMRGHAFRIDRDGTNWRKLETAIVGGITAAAGLGDDRLALVSTAGDILVGSADTGGFHKLKAPREMLFAGVAFVGAGRSLASVGNGGALMVPLAQKR